jgi:hypothetical protein
MALNLDFTDKAQGTLQAAIQLAKDYANSQGTSVVTVFIVYIDSSLLFTLSMQYIPHTLRLYS